jgi:methyl-accepting chemotaxis protein
MLRTQVIILVSVLCCAASLLQIVQSEVLVGASIFFALLAILLLYFKGKICQKAVEDQRRINAELDTLRSPSFIDVMNMLSEKLLTVDEQFSKEMACRLVDFNTEEDFLTWQKSIEIRIKDAEQLLNIANRQAFTDSWVFLQFARAIVSAVPDKTEEAAFQVMEKIVAVRENSAKASESSRQLRLSMDNSEQGASLRDTAEMTRNAIQEELQAINNLSDCLKTNRSQLSAMAIDVKNGLDLLAQISDITERSKLIAFNMSIEAARIGEKGRGFKVIIAELHKLNQRTLDFSARISDLLKRFNDYNDAMVSSMEVQGAAVIHKVQNGIDSANNSVQALVLAADKSFDFTQEVLKLTESVDADMDGVLESLQFQDITRQMIEGGVSLLDELGSCLKQLKAGGLPELQEEVKKIRFADIQSRLVGAAKTKGEKQALLEVKA